MAVTVHGGFDLERVGAITFTLDEQGVGTSPVGLSSGTYCHISLEGVLGAGSYDDLADDLGAALTAASGVGGYGVFFNTSTLTYDISGPTDFKLTNLSSSAQNALGMTAAQSYAASQSSNVGVYYSVICAPVDARSNDEQYEPDDLAEDAEVDGSLSGGLVDEVAPQYRDFEVRYIHANRVRSVDADTATFPFVLEDWWKHVRNIEPFAFVDDLTSQVHQMRARAARWRPQEWLRNHKDRFNLRFETRVLGDL